MNRFKIDYCDRGGRYIFGLYFFTPSTWLRRSSWKIINNFETRDEAVALYQKIKDLPEYLT